MTRQANYQYNFITLGLKNVEAAYHRVMNNIFKEEIGKTLEAYMDDMIVKSSKEGLHDQHLARVF